ncbi:MAG TPA: hypothetical protein P5530_03230 [Candidatus Diapherotrites archaeon]|mgnify:FL=1|nr:hypothetical protein [Candidatus Diapherotrites archaeon]
MKLGLPRTEKVLNYITYGIILSLVIAVVLEIINKNYEFLYITILSIILCLVPFFIQRKYEIRLPSEIQLATVLFIYSGVFLGEVQNFYVKYWWWDSLLHTFSGFAMGLVVFGALYVLYKTQKIKTKPIFIAIFIFSVTMTIGVLWEIYEFSFDSFAGGNMQRAKNLCPETGYCDSRLGLMDTMKDFMLNGIGAIFASVLGYIYIKKGEQFLLNGMIKRFIENNPKLFYK